MGKARKPVNQLAPKELEREVTRIDAALASRAFKVALKDDYKGV
jgi:hypothetical protein